MQTLTDSKVISVACPLGCKRTVASTGKEIHYCVIDGWREYVGTFDGQFVGCGTNCQTVETLLNDCVLSLIEDGLVDQPLALLTDPPTGDPNEPGPGPDTSRLIPCHTLHVLAQTEPAQFRAKLATLSEDDLATQAQLYALYAAIACGREISQAETLEHFKLSVDVHQATVRSEDAVCHVLWELALTDGPALVEFLRGHTDAQREQLAWRYAAWLSRECEITREPAHILKGWQQLIIGAAASGAERVQIEPPPKVA